MTPLPTRATLLAILLLISAPAWALEPFVATYDAYRAGKLAGSATMKVAQVSGENRWQVDLGVRGTRGLARLSGLDIQQSTLFDTNGTDFRPLSQATPRARSSPARRWSVSMIGTRGRPNGRVI